MYFVDPDLPLYLHTDASDYGIGGYLFQIIDDVERPCAFISKSLVNFKRRPTLFTTAVRSWITFFVTAPLYSGRITTIFDSFTIHQTK
jgi:hypothetical protein